MKTLVALCAILAGGVVLAGEPVSVLNHSAPAAAAPVAAPAPAVQTAPAPTTSGPAIIALPRRGGCPNGRCQLYSVEEQTRESTRNRVLGGQVIRRGNRTVVRPVR